MTEPYRTPDPNTEPPDPAVVWLADLDRVQAQIIKEAFTDGASLSDKTLAELWVSLRQLVIAVGAVCECQSLHNDATKLTHRAKDVLAALALLYDP